MRGVASLQLDRLGASFLFVSNDWCLPGAVNGDANGDLSCVVMAKFPHRLLSRFFVAVALEGGVQIFCRTVSFGRPTLLEHILSSSR
jgi:hypothetical protein